MSTVADYTQFYSIFTLQRRLYEGVVPLAEVRGAGDLGIGTFNRINGELLLLDGDVYRLRADGSAQRVLALDECTPYAVVARYRADSVETVSRDVKMAVLHAQLDAIISARHEIHAVRIEGRFRSIRTRAPNPERPPFRDLAELIAEQPEMTFTHIDGTLVGFYTPEHLGVLGVPGYHLHFIDASRRHGGHVQDFTAVELRIGSQRLSRLNIRYPGGTV